MKLLHYEKDGKIKTGIVENDLIYDLRELASSAGISKIEATSSIDEILSKNLLNLVKEAGTHKENVSPIPLSSVALKSPVLLPQKIFLAAINYVSHSKEQKAKPLSVPYFFTKFRNALIGPGEPIVVPKASKKVDWEVELAVIIGRRGKYISRENAMNHVAGYAISNDISFRDLQFPMGGPPVTDPFGNDWVKGKGLDCSFPLGPWMVTTDEIRDPYGSEISLRVNGIERQKSRTGEMVFKIDQLIEFLSNGITLEPGDVISTGTPLGVAIFTGVPYLKHGDIVEASISTIGSLRNPVVLEE